MNPRWNGHDWIADIEIPPWSVFTSGRDIVAARFLTNAGAAPALVQVRSLESLPDVAAALLADAMVRMRTYYDSLRPKYAAFARRAPSFMGDPDIAMPVWPDANTFVRLHKLQKLFVLPIEREGKAYIGFSFRPTWEPEHGLGLMTHGARVISIGHGDESFAFDAAEDDVRRG
jgi:hypothetical protein